MRLHYFQHVPYEGPGNVLLWAKERNVKVSGTLFFENEYFPDFEEFDILVIMGGPMSVHDEKDYPFLIKEKRFIESAIKNDKKVLGICLGAQMIAQVLGSKVYKNKYKEIGWFDVFLTENREVSKIFYDFPASFTPFHWHGETFDLPKGALWIAKSEGCENQAFEYNDGKVIGLQFHMEINEDLIRSWLEEGIAQEKDSSPYIQTPKEIISKLDNINENKELLFKLLDRLASL